MLVTLRLSVVIFISYLFAASLVLLADEYPLILRGKVLLEDGSPPPKTANVERICSDGIGSAPGPLVNKQGEYQWRMMVDPLRTRVCRIEASSEGYTSTSIDVSALNGYNNTTQELPPLILTLKGANPRAIDGSSTGVPGKAQAPFKAAMKAMDAGNSAEMVKQLQAAVAAAPQFARGWHALGLAYEQQDKRAEAQDAYEHGMAADPKFLASFVNVEPLYLKSKNWQQALKNADVVIKADTKKMFPSMYMYRAVAQFRTNDLDGAKASVEEAMKHDSAQKMPRTEYILGRVLLAKGDLAGARAHIMHYFELDPTAPDIELLSAHFQKLGTPEAASVDPALERP